MIKNYVFSRVVYVKKLPPIAEFTNRKGETFRMSRSYLEGRIQYLLYKDQDVTQEERAQKALQKAHKRPWKPPNIPIRTVTSKTH